MADEFRPDDDDRILTRSNPVRERHGRRGRRVMTALIAVAAVLGFGVILLYAYNKGKQDAGSGAPPVIQAQEGMTKVRPETPGGMNVPDRDKEIFSRLETGDRPDNVERLLPPPDKPVARPQPAVPEAPEPAAGAGQKAEPPGSAASSSSSSGQLPPMPSPPAPRAEKPVTAKEPPSEMKMPSLPPPPPPVAAPAPAPAAPVASKPDKPATAAPASPEPTARADGGTWKVQLASLRTEAAARQSWTRVQRANRDVLGNLDLTVQKIDLSGGKGTYYRVQAGPLASQAAATALCADLKARKLSCLVVRP